MTRDRSYSFDAPSGGRVDRLAGQFIPRSVFSRDDTVVIVNGRPVKKSHRTAAGDHVEVRWTEEVFESLAAEDIPLNVLYEDESILVIDKPAGLVVHPGAGNWSGTLVNALIHRYGEAFSTCTDDGSEEDILRPGIVHRLDKDTSGVMVIAKTGQAHRALAAQFAAHSNEKVYVAVVKGRFTRAEGTVDANIVRNPDSRKTFMTTDDSSRGRNAVTHYRVIRQTDSYAFVRVRIETGRTHQIRVHMKSIGHPVLGDVIYSRPDTRFPDCGLCLHAMSLTVDHPVTGERLTFRSRLPERMRVVLKELFAL